MTKGEFKRTYLVLSAGDPRNVNTWSNVPYFFTKHLELSGNQVYSANIGPNKYVEWVYNKVVGFLRYLGMKSRIDFFHSAWFAPIAQRKIKRALAHNPQAVPVFMTFTFGAPAERPYIVFSDRTFAYYIDYFYDRALTPGELRCAHREDRVMNAASKIISLFPDFAEVLRNQYGPKVYYLGNVVNLPPSETLRVPDLDVKWNARKLLFIGKPHYKAGLTNLLNILPQLNEGQKHPYTVHVVGCTEKDVAGKMHNNVVFHGYLDKANPKHYETYLHLLHTACLFVNPNLQWASFSASCEALYSGTPLVLHAYDEFVATFGQEEHAWWYVKKEGGLLQTLQCALQNQTAWRAKSLVARAQVEPFTWERYVRAFELALTQ